MLHFFHKMGKIPDLDWTSHIKMDSTQSLRKNQLMAKISPSQSFLMKLLAHFTVLWNQELAVISWNLVKIAILREI